MQHPSGFLPAHNRPAVRPDRAHLRNHARGAMLGLALGDALGATVEFMTPREIAAQWGCHQHIRGGGWLRLPVGQVTDDTTMAFALAEACLTHAPEPSAEHYAQAFDNWMRAKPVDIGNTVRRGIVRFRASGEACVPASEDAGNGAAMRCAPIALYLFGASTEAIVTATLKQAHVTHHNSLSDAATISIVHMVQAGLNGEGIRGVMAVANQLARNQPCFKFRCKQQLNPSAYIIDTMRVVLQAIDINDSFETVLIDVVNRGGDADTTGAIAGMIMGALYGETGLPERWLRELEKTAAKRCIDYADRLIEHSPAWRAI
jgi:ADP-ribosyl-[dinitrogen reductase] hydrolase